MKKLFSPFPHVLPIALTSGHTFVVTQEPVDVPDMYVAEAMSRGAQEAKTRPGYRPLNPEEVAEVKAAALRAAAELSAETLAQALDQLSPEAAQPTQQHPTTSSNAVTPQADQLAQQRAEKIKEALTAMVNGSDEADFTKDGAPQLARVKARTGFSVSRAEVDGVWAEISAAL